MRANVDPSVDFLTCGELYLQAHIIWRVQRLIAVNQGLIQVQDNRILN